MGGEAVLGQQSCLGCHGTTWLPDNWDLLCHYGDALRSVKGLEQNLQILRFAYVLKSIDKLLQRLPGQWYM